jgi:hypothetical protein
MTVAIWKSRTVNIRDRGSVYLSSEEQEALITSVLVQVVTTTGGEYESYNRAVPKRFFGYFQVYTDDYYCWEGQINQPQQQVIYQVNWFSFFFQLERYRTVRWNKFFNDVTSLPLPTFPDFDYQIPPVRYSHVKFKGSALTSFRVTIRHLPLNLLAEFGEEPDQSKDRGEPRNPEEDYAEPQTNSGDNPWAGSPTNSPPDPGTASADFNFEETGYPGVPAGTPIRVSLDGVYRVGCTFEPSYIETVVFPVETFPPYSARGGSDYPQGCGGDSTKLGIYIRDSKGSEVFTQPLAQSKDLRLLSWEIRS